MQHDEEAQVAITDPAHGAADGSDAARARQLEDAFELFNQMSSQLEASYAALENRVAELNEELAAARSERLRQLAEKERLANRLEGLLDVLPGGIVVLDGEGMVTQCNPAAVDLLGEPLTGVRWHEIVERAFERESDAGSDVALRNGRKVSISTRSLDPEPGQIVLLMDVTEQHALKELVNRHQKLSAMGEMAASLAHQVRTPLASALLYVSHLGRNDLSGDGRRRFTEKVIGRLRHLEHMVNDMLQFARSGSFEMDNVAVDDLAEDLLQTLEPQLVECNGRIAVTNRASGAQLRGNREALQSALLNLATNAIQASGSGVNIDIEIKADHDGEIAFRMSDDGPGIDEETRAHLFTPFFTTRPDGTGLGLSVVRTIVLAHEGQVWAESEGGAGATFVVRIPAAHGGDALPSGYAEKRGVAGALHLVPEHRKSAISL
jgi:two-component system sensor histidine kinase FlrB